MSNQANFRLIALDLDGTLTNSDKIVTPRTRQALLRAQDLGAKVVLASGRPTYGIAPIAECLEMNERGGYVLAYNGGKIIEWKSKDVVYEKFLPADVVPVLHGYAREHHFALLGYNGTDIVTEMPDDQYVKEESRINKMPIRQVDELPLALETHPAKLLMTGHPSAMEAAEQELLALVGNRMDLFRSAPFFIELVPKGIDKALSLQRLLADINLTAADLIAFGDGYNDLSMLRLAGLGVAMANAVPEVRADADYVTLSNDNDGVGVALEKWIPGILE